MKTDLVVVGGGPAGMMAALTAAKEGAKVILAEKNNRPGKKLAITGAGRCNLTNLADLNEIIANIPGNGRFLYSALGQFNPERLMAFFQDELHVPLKVERGRRVFPESDQAQDIVAALTNCLKTWKVTLFTQTTVARLEIDPGARSLRGVYCASVPPGKGGAQRYIETKKVVIATGGLSYPGTGSDGDGYRLAQAAGHTVTPLRPSLVPLETAEGWPLRLQGLTLTNVSVTSYHGDKKIQTGFGELLFTHFGISGPTVLSLSRAIVPYVQECPGSVTVRIDLKPGLDEAVLDLRLQRDFAKFSRKIYQNSLEELLPRKLIPVIVELSGIDPVKPAHQITRAERLNLVKLCKGLSVTITKPRPIAEAIVTAGGIATKEIDPKTMESRKIPGLYFAGEVVDVDGYTGGYNLQIAFSMGYVAGMAAARSLLAASETTS
ncbi:MAG: NAD(P)/FAD-dependent oxidoreductase [Firmicutes bacterium]|nr:NAD(P)/FAD-dependent oxidoreductase [Bacillota bacterium]